MTRSRLLVAFTLLAALAPAVAVIAVGTNPYMLSADLHFFMVSAVAAIASFSSLALSIAGARARDGRTVLMGMAFSTMTALFAVHALATPGFIVGMNGVIALAGGLSVPVGALLLSLTALPSLRRPGCVQNLIIAQGVLFSAVLLFGLLGLSHPDSVPAVPLPKSAPAIGLLVAGLLFLGQLF